ncbi:polyprenyl synthetase family protein [Streptomyces collinus]|uniref:polyprenyl synthetase family protein n=1 Tax=Streptomyces collinus TaxID=42684 RepID=UPI0036BDA37F
MEGPLHIGATLAKADESLLQGLSAFALPLDEAFQLRDDLLGVFGDPAHTGKPNLNALREGKRTVLIALTLQAADPVQEDLLRDLYGNPGINDDDVDQIRVLNRETGAVKRTEEMIINRYHQARTALEPAHPHRHTPPTTPNCRTMRLEKHMTLDSLVPELCGRSTCPPTDEPGSARSRISRHSASFAVGRWWTRTRSPLMVGGSQL